MNPRPVVLLFEDSRKGLIGGGQQVTLELMDALASDFHLIMADTSKDSPFAREVQNRRVEGLLLCSTSRLSRGTRAALQLHWKEYLLYPFHFILNVRRLCRFLRSGGLNPGNTLFYAAHKKHLPLVWWMRRFFAYPYLYHAHTMDPPEHPLFPLVRMLQRPARGIIAVSQAVGQNINLPQTRVIHNSLRLSAAASPKKPQQPFVAAAFATLLVWKGLDVLMRSPAYSRYKEDIRVEIYGAGPHEDELKKLESPGCRLLGHVKDPYRIMRERVSLLIVPSIKPESFGRVSLEGFAFGIPAVASDLGGQREIIEEGRNGFLVPPGDPAALAAAMDKIYEDQNLYQKLSLGALKTAGKFTYSDFARQVRRFFRDTHPALNNQEEK